MMAGSDELVRQVTRADRAVWEAAVAADPDAIVTQTPRWMDAMEATGRYVDTSLRFVLRDGRELVLPLARRRGPIGSVTGHQGFATGWGIGGLIGSGLDRIAVQSVMGRLADHGLTRLQIRPNPLHGSWYQAVVPAGSRRVLALPKRAHVIDLREGSAAVWSAFSKSARRCVRAGERGGLDVLAGNDDALLSDYQMLHERSLVRWAERQHEPALLARLRSGQRDGIEKWRTVARALGPSFTVWVARLRGEPLAAMLLLTGPNAHETRAAFDRERSGPLAPSYLLTWMALERACADGASWYHLGETGTSSSLAAYKERFGAKAYDYADHRVERLPVTHADLLARRVVKRVIGFEEAS
jgi:hypothetical protein